MTSLQAAVRAYHAAVPKERNGKAPNDELVLVKLNGYLLGRPGGLGQLFFPCTGLRGNVKIRVQARHID